jgi:hypothetical protein
VAQQTLALLSLLRREAREDPAPAVRQLPFALA